MLMFKVMMKNRKVLIISMLLGAVFGFFAYSHAASHIEWHAIATENGSLDLNDVLVTSFLHHDFDQFDYLWPNDSTILLSPIVFYLIGSLLGAHAFLRKNKGYYYFVYSRCQSHVQLVSKLLRGIGFPVLIYQVFYWGGLFVGMSTLESDFIAPMLTISIRELVAFFIMRFLVLIFLVLVTFIVFIKKEAAIAMLVNTLTIALILLTSIHVGIINLALFDELSSMFISILVWIIINLAMYALIKFGITYELS